MFQGTGVLAFNATFYLQNNPDVFQAIQTGAFQGSALDHFVQFGQFEGRDPNAFFDTEYYLAQNPDVLTAIADPAVPSVVSAFQHFVDFGNAEGVVRAPSAAFASFNPDTYLAQNPDLQAAFGNLTGEAQDRALFDHFVTFGVNENRPGSGVDLAPTNPGVPGSVFTLTTNPDALNGTANNDLFIATEDTLTAGDVINGGGGFDTLRINAADDLASVTPTLISVEAIDARVADTKTATVDLSDSTGVQQVSLTNSAGTAAFTGVTAPVGINLTNSSGDISVAYAAGVASPAAGQNVSLNGAATGSSVTVGNASTFNLTATGANTLGALTGSTTAGSALSTVNVGGNGSLVLTTALAASVTTLNASANSGGVDVAFQGTKDVTATGGSGDDTFRFGSTLTVKDTVNGGAGFDTVVVNAANYSSATAAAAFNGLKSIERVEFVDGGATVLDGATFTNTGITNLLFNGGGNDTINNAGAARTYEFGTSNAGNATFSMTAGQTELNLALLGEEDGADADVGAITVALPGAAAGTTSTINLVSEGDLTTTVTDGVEQFDGSAVYNNVGTVSAVAGSTVNISGEGNLDIAGFTNVVNVDASSFTGLLVIEGSNITPTSVTDADILAAAATVASDVITLGDARSTVQFSDADASGVFVTSGTGLTAVTTFNVDVIENFTAGAGGDILDITTATATYVALADSVQTSINSAGSLQAAADLAAAAVTGAVTTWTAFEFGGETYALYDAVDAGGYDAANDILVQISGVNVDDLVVANFA